MSGLSAQKRQGVSIALEWKEYNVSYYGDSLQSKMASLRKKISRHKDSSSHIAATEICSKAEKQTLEQQVDVMNKAEMVKTERVIRTAYFLAKEDGPFSDHPHLFFLQELNGVDLGIGLRPFSSVFEKLHSIYSRSPKNQHKLDDCAEEIGHVRWVASSYRTVSAVWNNYQSLYMHF